MQSRTIAAMAVAVWLSASAHAQWTETPGGDAMVTPDKVGIGVDNPSQKLEVNGNVRIVPASGSFSVGGAAPAGYQFFSTNAASGVSTGFQLHSNYSTQTTSFIGNFGQFGTYIAHNREPQAGTFVNGAASPNQRYAAQVMLGDTYASRMRLFAIANFPNGNEAVHFVVKWDGNVGIGPGVETLMVPNSNKRLVVAGDIEVSGNINAKYQDIAEWVPASSDLPSGTVVVLNPDRDNEIMASTRAYDTSVAGVVAEQPGLTLGEASDSKEKVATMGRVLVRVDASLAPIAIGDLLVTSDRPGYAMKSKPFDVAGMSIHRPGTILGKALQALPAGEGEILVLLSLQ